MLQTKPRCKCPSRCRKPVGFFNPFGSSRPRPRDICDGCHGSGCTRSRIGAQCPGRKRKGFGVSINEHDRWTLLQERERTGEITDLRKNPQYDLYVPARDGGADLFICPFALDSEYVVVATGELVSEDAKRGLISDEFRFKCRVFHASEGRQVTIVHRRGSCQSSPVRRKR